MAGPISETLCLGCTAPGKRQTVGNSVPDLTDPYDLTPRPPALTASFYSLNQGRTPRGGECIPPNIFRMEMIMHLLSPILEEIVTRLLWNIQRQVTVGRAGSNQRAIAVSAPVRLSL